MTAKVTIVDYGSGNLLSISRALEATGATVDLTDEPDRVGAAERLVVPGVGAFGKTVQQLHDRGLVDPIRHFTETGRPFLGICVGMQMMLDFSDEFGRHEGLGLIPGHVSAIPPAGADGTPHPVPHIGWSGLDAGDADWRGSILDGVAAENAVYFVHSFHALPKSAGHILASCDYDGRAITAAIAKDNMTGCQFHPEKSGPLGQSILENFIHLGAADNVGNRDYG